MGLFKTCRNGHVYTFEARCPECVIEAQARYYARKKSMKARLQAIIDGRQAERFERFVQKRRGSMAAKTPQHREVDGPALNEIGGWLKDMKKCACHCVGCTEILEAAIFALTRLPQPKERQEES